MDKPNKMAFVPNVQEMVKCDPLQVPEKFLIARDEEETKANGIADACCLSSQIPIIDLSLLSAGHKEELSKLEQACAEWGFFQVVNHGVATEVLQEMKDGASKFFNLPLEEKNKISMSPDERQGYGQVFPNSHKMDWSDTLLLNVYPAQYKQLKVWPTRPCGFKEAIETYSSEVKRVGEELIRFLSIVMGMEKDALLGLHQEMIQTLRVNYIPPCSRPDKVLGLSPHSDTSTITILMQEDHVTGLQIRKEGEWVQVKPISNALVVNVGDAFEIWSNGKYKSIEHRAVANEGSARISYASFLCPSVDAEVEPFEHLVQSSSRMYKKVKYGDYLFTSLKGKLEGKAHTDMAKIASKLRRLK